MALPTRFNKNDDLYKPLADINVTPLVDVMLVLLIIFMVTAPLLAKGMKVNLPQARASTPVHDKKPIVVVVGKGGKVALGTEELSPDALVDGVRAMMGEDYSKVVHLRGDMEASYGDVVAVMDRLGKNGIAHIAIMTKPAGGGAAKASGGAQPGGPPR